ncbi:MAG: putative inorganic carbon transporter subunit DabA [Acidovorax sp.]
MCSGLPLHLLHDGQTLRHTPPRLSAFTEAPRQAIDAVMDQHAVVRHLIGNGWMHLFWLEPEGAGVA